MRIDLALKYLCLAKSRTIAKTLCDRGAVLINGATARAAATVHPGDRVVIRHPEKSIHIEIVEVPPRQTSKTDAPHYYRVIG